MKCCADEAGAGRPHVDQPEAADLHHVAAATVDAEDIRCCSASSNEKKKLTIKGCFMLKSLCHICRITWNKGATPQIKDTHGSHTHTHTHTHILSLAPGISCDVLHYDHF